MSATLIYVHDPMCSWCYGFATTLRTLFAQLPTDIQVTRLLGGLAPDSTEPMPESTRAMVKQNWQRIEQAIPGVQFNYDFWIDCEPRRATYPACRAVIAARKQGDAFDGLMTEKIQQAYYQQARNPSDNKTLIELAVEIGLSADIFSNDLMSAETQEILIAEIDNSRSLGVNSFPSLLLKNGEEYNLVGTNYTQAEPMLSQIKVILQQAVR
jgi:putative protein-disulfide isomerase